MINTIFWTTGAIFWTGIALTLAWLLGEVLWGLACAVSYTRCAAGLAQRSGAKPTLAQKLRVVLGTWWELIGYRNNGNTRYYWTNGEWRGVGDHTLCKEPK